MDEEGIFQERGDRLQCYKEKEKENRRAAKFYVNLTQDGVILEERTSPERTCSPDLSVGNPVAYFLDW